MSRNVLSNNKTRDKKDIIKRVNIKSGFKAS